VDCIGCAVTFAAAFPTSSTATTNYSEESFLHNAK